MTDNATFLKSLEFQYLEGAIGRHMVYIALVERGYDEDEAFNLMFKITE